MTDTALFRPTFPAISSVVRMQRATIDDVGVGLT